MRAGWRNWLIVELTAENGLKGMGEATLRSRENSVRGAFQDLSRQLIGRDAREIQPLWRSLFAALPWRGGAVLMTALSALDQALWDLCGKALGVPVFRLMGGSPRPLAGYANGWAMDSRGPDDCLRHLDRILALGYRAAKWDPFVGSGPYTDKSRLINAVEQVRAVRNTAGRDFRILIEMHGRFEPATALRAAEALAEFDCFFIEEPLPPENVGGLLEVCRRSPIAVAAGERYYERSEFAEVLRADSIRVAQPDVCHAGGISECLKIAAMAEAWQIAYAPHNTSGPVGTLAALHTGAVATNFLFQESFPFDFPLWNEVARTDTVFRDGAFHLSGAPGLGVELDWDAVSRHPSEVLDRFLV